MMSIQQPFAPQPGGMVHPGMPPGHQMGPGQAGHPGHLVSQPGGMVQGMHPGVSGPQVSQGPVVTGVPQGQMGTAVGIPSAHAMQHLGPTQANFMHQPNMGGNFNAQMMAHNPSQAQYVRHRQMIMQQQQHASQQMAQGVPVSMANGHPINASQLQAMQQSGQMPGNMPMQMQRPGMPGQGMPQNMEQYQAQQQQQRIAHQLAMQQAANAANNGQPNQQPPQRPPTAQPMQIPDQGGPPQGQQQQAQQPQPPVTQPQQQQGPNPQHQPQPQPTPQQQNQQLPQQNQNQSQPQAGGQQQMNPQDAAQMKAQQQQHQEQMAAVMQARMQQHQHQQAAQNSTRNSVLSLLSFGDQLSKFSAKNQPNEINYWCRFVDRFFSPGGVLRQQLWNSKDQSTKTYEINFAALPRYYWTLFSTGIHNIQMIIENARERELSNGSHFVESGKSSFIYWLTNDCQLVTLGNLRAQFDANGKMEVLDLVIAEHTEYIPRRIIRTAPESPDQKSPRVSKNLGKRAQQQQQRQAAPSQPPIQLPVSPTNDYGITNQLLQFLELAEAFSLMQPLFSHAQKNPHLAPADALQNLVDQYRNAANQNQMNPAMFNNPNLMAANMNPHLQPGGQVPPGQRTPSLNNNNNNPNVFASPASGHLNLPGAQNSPHLSNTGAGHTPSPAQQHLAGPVAMVQQQSQTGTNASGSQGTSANTSPNVTNKRRRTSAVKTEGEEGAEVNGATGGNKVKASPRVGGKRQKGTA